MMSVVCSSYALHPEEVAGKKSICTNAEKSAFQAGLTVAGKCSQPKTKAFNWWRELV